MASPVVGEHRERAGGPSDQTWYAPGLSFVCTQCGNCCTGPTGFVWFSEEEGRALAAAAGVDEATFYERFAVKKYGRWSLRETKRKGKYDCVFLKHDPATGKAGCSVYGARPTQCRTWPFWDSNLKSEEAWKRSSRDCPGMKLPGEAGGTFVPIEQIRVTLATNPEGL